ncbi:MAG: hypothetical protein QXQ94_09735 [Candidatus Bathyarchaeia archaeon]
MVGDESFLSEVYKILNSAEESNVTLRLLGSIAIRLHSETAKRQVIPRALTDIDFVGYSKEKNKIEKIFENLEYTPDENFNAFHGSERLIYNKGEIRVDIFLDKFSMCHQFDFRKRLKLDFPTLSVSDLLITKLQIVQLDEKDLKDIIFLLNDHELSDTDNDREKINAKYIAKLCSDNWGIYKTFTMNVNRVLRYLEKCLDQKNAQIKVNLKDKCSFLLEIIEKEPKSLAWKTRAIIGEKRQWYQLPEINEKQKF